VAIVLETARRLSGQATSSQVRFVAFGTEEDPWFGTNSMGSLVYATEADDAGDTVRGALILDMAGYFTSSDRYALAGALPTGSQALLNDFESLFEGGTTMTLNRLTGSGSGLADTDTSSFWDLGFPALVLTSPGWNLDEEWHTSGDTWDRLDYDRMAELTDGLAAAARGL
jgi:Zn-dependent M28 family amino/carboxypeptidase